MPLTFSTVLSAGETKPDGRFPEPKANDNFAWFKFAQPAPHYLICVAKIVDIAPEADPEKRSKITCQFFLKDGKLDPNRVPIDLADWNQAWKTLPSTIVQDPLPEKVGGLDANTCAVLCVSEAHLYLHAKTVWAESWPKYPYAEDSTEAKRVVALSIPAVKELAAALEKLIGAERVVELPAYRELRTKCPDLF